MDSENKIQSNYTLGIKESKTPQLLISDFSTSSGSHPTIAIETVLTATENSIENVGKENNDKTNLLPPNLSLNLKENQGKVAGKSSATVNGNKLDCLSPNVNSKGKDPRIARSTSLKTTTTTNSPNEKKIVRFADALGLDLADVRHFSKECLPKISKSAFADLKLVPVSKSSRNHSRKGKVHKGKTLVLQFDQPGADPQFFNRVKNEKVCLENVQVNGTTVRGMIMVSNLGFEKLVQIRYTTDNWTSITDITAEFVPSCSTDKSFDRFSFKIGVHILQNSEKLIFVIKYTVNGQDYWDNNHGKDYILECRSNTLSIHYA